MKNDMETFTIDDFRVWTRREINIKTTNDGYAASIFLWESNWWCDDGDGVSLEIEVDGGGFNLRCFSGIPASSIYVDCCDFGTMWRKAFKNSGTLGSNNKNEVGSIQTYTYVQQCIMMADYLCSLFCEYS